jgi:hypothetical protein
MHVEATSGAEYDVDEDAEKQIDDSDKRVKSDPCMEPDSAPATKTLTCDREPMASVAGGNNGNGSALIICKYPRLMHYIDELEK